MGKEAPRKEGKDEIQYDFTVFAQEETLNGPNPALFALDSSFYRITVKRVVRLFNEINGMDVMGTGGENIIARRILEESRG